MNQTSRHVSGRRIDITTGATGKLYAQITNGAPFDALLAADVERPERLAASGAGLAGTVFIYARGRLALWSAVPGAIPAAGDRYLRALDYRRLAVANPDLAPYGLAARQVLQSLAVWDAVQARIVTGENVGQAHAMVATGNADAGLVALADVLRLPDERSGSYWLVPAHLHEPIEQAAVLLRHGEDNPAAREFLDYLQTPEARTMIGIVLVFEVP
ncbi:MAG: molybdate ABC transporter substrate-binding protein [Woeseiaceae bacterium]|nr:molybdate ABC transporter substrate-binding protein [Woeseiaceae bacterium]